MSISPPGKGANAGWAPESVWAKMARWHDEHALAFPPGHPNRAMHREAALELWRKDLAADGAVPILRIGVRPWSISGWTAPPRAEIMFPAMAEQARGYITEACAGLEWNARGPGEIVFMRRRDLSVVVVPSRHDVRWAHDAVQGSMRLVVGDADLWAEWQFTRPRD